MDNVIGINISYDKPDKCDLVIDNTNKDSLNEKVEQIIELTAKK